MKADWFRMTLHLRLLETAENGKSLLRTRKQTIEPRIGTKDS